MTYVDNMNSFFRVNISQFFIEKEHYGNLWNRVKISFQQTKVKGITTPSVKRQASSGSFEVYTCHDARQWIWDPFWNITMHSNGTLPLDAPLAARCGYSLRVEQKYHLD